jgi:2',3'-cyclic-nucleotide 2'-phosphodiesterase/3'-nucleotidase
LREQERCDAVVVLTHQGFERDPRSGEVYSGQIPGENAGYALATEVPGIDLIILGHTHRDIPFQRIGDVLLTQAGHSAENLGQVTLRFSRASADDSWQLGEKRADILPVTLEVQPDESILTAVADYAEMAEEYLAEVVADAKGVFSARLGRLEDNAVLDLIHATQLEYGDADISLAALFDTDAEFGPGPVRVRDLASIYVYENTLYTIEVTGKMLRGALENSARYFNRYDFGRTDAPIVNPRFPGFNFDTAQGVDYEIDLTEPPGSRIKNLRYRGRPLKDTRTLRLALNSYRMSGSGGYGMFAGAKVLQKTNEGVRELLVQYARDKGTISPQADGNWHPVPSYLAHESRSAVERLVRLGGLPEEEAKKLDVKAKLSRATYATWLGMVYGTVGGSGDDLPFGDIPNSMIPGIVRAAETGAFVGYKDDFFRPMDDLDLLSAVDWTAHAAHGGRIPNQRGRSVGREKRPVVPPELRPETEHPYYGKKKLPSEVEEYALRDAYLAEWRAGADPMKLTAGDGAALLASARFPVITILETSDFHGALLPRHRERQTERPLGSTPVLAAYIQRERGVNPEGTLLLDGGDLMQGTLISNLSFGKPVIAQMNYLDYDATAVGNHEFDWSVDTLFARIQEAEFAALGANLLPVGDSRTTPGK